MSVISGLREAPKAIKTAFAAMLIMQAISTAAIAATLFMLWEASRVARSAELYAREAYRSANEVRDIASSARDAARDAATKATEAACLARNPGTEATAFIDRLGCMPIIMPPLPAD